MAVPRSGPGGPPHTLTCPPRRSPTLRRILLALALLLLGGALGLVWTRPPGNVGGPPLPAAQLSLLAVGDTGEPPGWLPLDPQRRVGRALLGEHRARPVAGFVLLGDNFYPSGLVSHELVERVRVNLVRPYCGFVALRGPRSSEVADACPSGVEHTDAFPIFAVLGNHDYESAESPGLEREAVPAFVSNWRMPSGAAEVYELPGGVSLVLTQSEELLHQHDATPLRDALARSRGPWRIVALHRP